MAYLLAGAGAAGFACLALMYALEISSVGGHVFGQWIPPGWADRTRTPLINTRIGGTLAARKHAPGRHPSCDGDCRAHAASFGRWTVL